MTTTLFLISLFLFLLLPSLNPSLPVCRNSCGHIQIDYPFAIDDGCGAPLYRNMLNCSTTFAPSSTANTVTTNTNTTVPVLIPTIGTPATASTTDLFFETPSGNYKVESIDYASKTLTIYDPSMSTCTILQPHRDFLMTDVQSAVIPPSPDTVFALMNCSVDSPVLNHYKSVCFNFSGDHSCGELYGACTSFKIFQMLSNNTPPPCCFTSYSTVKFMSMNILDCTHYTTFYDVEKLKGVKPLDWSYGIKLSYSLPETGCYQCRRSGGTCGFDVETQGLVCICSSTLNSTRECAAGTAAGNGKGYMLVPFVHVNVIIFILFAFALL